MTSNRIRELRRARGMSQETLGARIGTDKGGVSRLESGKTKLDIGRARDIAKALDTTVDEVLGIEMPGLREDATPYNAAPGDPFARLAGENEFLYTIKSDVLDEIGLKAGDLVVITNAASALATLESGQAVIATLSDSTDPLDQSKAITIIRQFIAPRLLSTNSRTENHPPLNISTDNVAILGIIRSRHTKLTS